MNASDKAALLDHLHALILDAAPNAEMVEKYGGILYTNHPELKEGQFCGLFTYEHHVQLVFSQGAKLNNSDGLLQGKGKLRRHINFKNVFDIDDPTLVALLRSAATQ